MTIEIRTMQLADESAVSDICFSTSEWGKLGKEELRMLVALRWCLHYLWYETAHCHVAVDTAMDNTVVGYLLCAPDTDQQEMKYQEATLPLLKAEIKRLAPTIGVERVKLEKEFFFLSTNKMGERVRKVAAQFPAHIHIDIYPSHHRMGIGRMLFAAHEAHLREMGSPGYHLGVSAANEPAVKFYTALGMTDMVHLGGPLNFAIIFSKGL